MIAGLSKVDFADPDRYANIYARYRPNNAYLISFLDYRERQDEFDSLFTNHYRENLADFIQSWKKLYSN
jgi:hypothetical protein